MEGTAAGVTSSTLSRSSTVEEGDFLEGAEAKLPAPPPSAARRLHPRRPRARLARPARHAPLPPRLVRLHGRHGDPGVLLLPQPEEPPALPRVGTPRRRASREVRSPAEEELVGASTTPSLRARLCRLRARLYCHIGSRRVASQGTPLPPLPPTNHQNCALTTTFTGFPFKTPDRSNPYPSAATAHAHFTKAVTTVH